MTSTVRLNQPLGSRIRVGVTLGIFLGIFLLLAFVALGLAESNRPLGFEKPLAAFIRDRAFGPRWTPFSLLNELGSLPIWDTLVILAGVALWLWGRRPEAVLVLAGLSVEVGTLFVKTQMYGPHPPGTELNDLLELTATGGFPSGHVARTTVTLGLLIALFVWRSRHWRLPVILLGMIFLLLMGVARIGSGSHWPSEVLGGYLLGGLWFDLLVLTRTCYYQLGARRLSE